MLGDGVCARGVVMFGWYGECRCWVYVCVVSGDVAVGMVSAEVELWCVSAEIG